MTSVQLSSPPCLTDYEPNEADLRESADAFREMDYGALCAEQQTEEYERWAWGWEPSPAEIRGWWERELAHYRFQRPSCLSLPMSLAGVDARIGQAETRLAALPDAEPSDSDRRWWAEQSEPGRVAPRFNLERFERTRREVRAMFGFADPADTVSVGPECERRGSIGHPSSAF